MAAYAVVRISKGHFAPSQDDEVSLLVLFFRLRKNTLSSHE